MRRPWWTRSSHIKSIVALVYLETAPYESCRQLQLANRCTRILVSAVLAAIIPISVEAQTIAIRAGRTIDPETGETYVNQVIVVSDGKITKVGTDINVPADARIIDLSKEAVLPGLFDAHTHLLATVDPKWDLGDFWIMSMQRRPGYRAILGLEHAHEMLDAGFTTVRDVGNSGDYLDIDLEKAIDFGWVVGPTIIPAGRIIAPFGGQFWDSPAEAKFLNNAEYYFADSRDEMRKGIRENIYWGAKVIKIVVDAKPYVYSTDDIRFMMTEAAAAGRKVAAHVQTERGARNAIEAGVASIEHGWVLTDQDLALAKQNHVVLVSTDFPENQLVALGMDPAQAKKTHASYIDRLRRANSAGVEIVFGTDVMYDSRTQTRGELAMEYIDSMVEAGLPSLAILKAMTTDAARLLGVEKERGNLKPGLAADIVAVSENPLENVDSLKHVDFVMKNGKVVKQKP
jgi:imidazolonepropionase-like amidohydrolase